MKKKRKTKSLMQNQTTPGMKLELRDDGLPSSPEEGHGHRAHGDHVGIFCHEEEGKFHAAVFDVEPAGQLRFCLRHIEGGPVDLCQTANNIKDKGNGLIPDIPVPEPPALKANDLGQPQTLGKDDHPDDRKTEGHLIADHLGRCPKGPHQTILIPGGPASQEDSKLANGGQAEDIEKPDIDIGHRSLTTQFVPGMVN